LCVVILAKPKNWKRKKKLKKKKKKKKLCMQVSKL
jgi:hypothetical protein